MKYILVIVSCSVILSCIAAGQIDTSLASNKTPELTIWGGLSFPYLPSNYRTYWKTGYNIGGGFGYSLDPGSLGYGAIYATVEYGRTNFDNVKYNDSLKVQYPQDTAFGGPVKLVNVMLNFKGTFSTTKKTVAPYFLIGVGYMYYTVAEISVAPDNSLTVSGISKGAISWTFGVGVEFPITEKMRAFIQGKSLLGASDPSRQYFPVSAGLTFTP